jgi:hypothetical protein
MKGMAKAKARKKGLSAAPHAQKPSAAAAPHDPAKQARADALKSAHARWRAKPKK